MGNAGSVFGICEACHAPRSEQDMICAACGYHFKTKPVPAYPTGGPPARRTDPPMIVEPPRTIPTSVPMATVPEPSRTAPRADPTMRSPQSPGEESSPRTMHSPSSPPVADRPVVPVAAWIPPHSPQPQYVQVPSAAGARRSSVPWVLVTVALVVLAASAVAALLVLRARREVAVGFVMPPTFDGPGGVAFGHLDAAPAEDFVGRYIQLSGATSALFVGAFSGDDMHELWHAGPFDLRSIETPPQFAIVGRHVLVGDTRPVLHVYDGATGRETHIVELADHATGIWVNGEKEAFIEVRAGAGVLYDAVAGRAKVSPPPAWVPPPGPARLKCTLAPASQSACIEPARARAMSFPGFSPIRALGVGDLGVALGRAAPRPAPEVLAFSLSTGAVRWRAPVSRDSAVDANDEDVAEADAATVFATYGYGPSPHVVALAAKDGARLWEAALPTINHPMGPRFLVVSASRLYVPRPGRLDVLDRATGAMLGGVGATAGR